MLAEETSEIHPKLRLDSVIARGSFGVVFKARQVAVARDVAVKVLHTGLGLQTEAGRLFREEIRAIGTLDHRNVVRIFDADETRDGRLYFVMELLDGPTLQHVVDASPIAPARATALVAQLLDGLAAVHAAGHIHADVKPANAVICGAGDDERVVLIDFGLSRVLPIDRPAEAVGGTRAYMAPEQLREWKVEAGSDVYSAALILVKLLTGGERPPNAAMPALDGIADPILRVAIERALAEDPAQRPSASDFARALRRETYDAAGPAPQSPFRELTPLTERDRLHGRADDLHRIARRIERARPVVLTAPSGTGKTSLLRAGLIPYLDASGRPWVYLACEPGAATRLAALLEPEAASLEHALQQRASRGQPLVVILDQLEVALANGEATALLDTLLAADVATVLGVREDFVARLLAASRFLVEGVPQVRLPPLDREGARRAIVSPLAERGIELAPDLLDLLLDDLTNAGRAMGLDDTGTDAAIYPPQLQLSGGALFDSLAADERIITREHYHRLGGFAAIVGEHLERTLGELASEDREVARELFLELVTSTHTRALRTEQELVDAVGGRHGDVAVRRVLARLEARRLIARTSSLDGIPSWSLVHDTLAPRIEAWLTVHDLDRRRTAEQLRFHLRVSQADAPATLSARQLATLAKFPGLVEELEVEWTRRTEAVWTPRSLVDRSRRQVRYRRGVIGTTAVAMLALTAVLIGTWLAQRHKDNLRLSNIGRIDLRIEAFDLKLDAAGALVDEHVDAPDLRWELFDPAADDPDSAGSKTPADRFEPGERRFEHGTLVETGIEVRGGDAFLKVYGRVGTCEPSVIPLRRLPGNDEYDKPREIRIRVPTCSASAFDTVLVPAGPFVFGGVGDPPSGLGADYLPIEEVVNLQAFSIDRTEITNAAFAVFAKQYEVHEVEAEAYTDAFAIAGGQNYPRSALDWFDARAYCRFLGKDLPTSRQWQKALRGGLVLPSGAPNPHPRRNVPWDDAPPTAPDYAGIVSAAVTNAHMQLGQNSDPRHPYPVGSHPKDTSVYGVVDLAGNVQEWTADFEQRDDGKFDRRASRVTRGGNWFDTTAELLDSYTALENPRSPHTRFQFVGARCAMAIKAEAVPSAGR